jgi:16S rRNA (uracil1498-N3)-methyltransferase
MQLFYTPDITTDNYTLDEQESKHCIRVLRMRIGDKMHLTNGKGSMFQAAITDANPKACQLKIVETIHDFEKRNYWLHIAIAPTKNIERIEWFLEKATEIGVDEITPIITEHSERQQIKPERLERIVIAAMKQSVKAYKPTINQAVSFNNFIKANRINTSAYIAHCIDTQKKHLKDVYVPNTNAVICIGPEGDFSKEEVNTALSNGCIPISLGNSRLRTETAGVVACHTISIVNG